MEGNNQARRAEARSLVEAAAWRTHLAETRAEDSEDFVRWLAASAENRAAWEHMQAPWDVLTEHANSPELIELRRAALDQVRAAGRQRSREALGMRRWMPHALAAGLGLVVAGALAFWMLNRPDIYSTGLGERRTVDLLDGSRLTLDSHSEVLVSYSDHSRELQLVRGQARFDVAHDAARPFLVRVQDYKVLATGTAFNVDRLNTRTFVTLIEGRVVVTHAGSRQRFELNPNDQLVLVPDVPPSLQAVSTDQIIAWQNGQLVFENEPLYSVVERVNRYSNRRIEIADPKTGALQVTGVFNSGDIDSFVATATGYLPLKAETVLDGDIRLSHQ